MNLLEKQRFIKICFPSRVFPESHDFTYFLFIFNSLGWNLRALSGVQKRVDVQGFALKKFLDFVVAGKVISIPTSRKKVGMLRVKKTLMLNFGNLTYSTSFY